MWRAVARTKGHGSTTFRRRAGSARDVLELLDVDVAILVVGPTDRDRERIGGVVRDFDASLARGDLDLADGAFRDVAAATEQGDQPLRIGVLRAPDVDREPRRVATAGAHRL